MILFRQKYPRWWFDWNLELQRFGNRVGNAYLAPTNHKDLSTDDHQWVELSAYSYPDAAADLNRWLPLVNGPAAIPHYIVLFFLDIAVCLRSDRDLVRPSCSPAATRAAYSPSSKAFSALTTASSL